MALIKMSLAIVVLVVSIYWTQNCMAQSGSSSACTSALISMSPCLNYVTGSSSTPTSSCCTQLSTVVKSQPECLCFALSGGASSLGITINKTLALELPKACNVQTPPVSECNGAPGDSPSLSPFGSTIDAPGSSQQGGSNTFPAIGGSYGDGPNMNTLLQVVLFVVFVVCHAWKFSSF